MSIRTVARLAAWTVVAVVALVFAPHVAPADPTLHPIGEALVVGGITGIALFAVLARRRVPAAVAIELPRRRLAARSIVLTAKSAQEEAIWRALVLGLLVDPLGRAGAVVVSTVLFAGAHLGRLGRASAAHLLTGAAFGSAYVATGRLHAAIAAHGTYNVLVGTAALASERVSKRDTGRARGGLVASVSLSRRTESTHQPALMPRNSSVATLEGVGKAFGAVRALAGVDLELRRGEIVALLGPNGAGKSTAVAIMLGLRRPDEGRATLFGFDPRDPVARRRAGAVLQEIGFPPGLRVRETVELTRAHFPGAIPTDEALGRLDLSALADRDAAGLSGGQRRRLAVALALTGNPQVLFLDEPTAGMDASARRRLLSDLRSFADGGGAVLLTTQQLAEAEEIATRIVLLARGRIVLTGSVPEVRARAGRARVTLRAAEPPRLRTAAAIETQGDRHVVYVDDADAFVSDLVLSGTPFSELAVVPVSLEDAFVTLTAEADP
ncbi:MAG TPA: ATP-binding cassette domain-containing protein [Gaiella sp.]|jgi:ABC-2 type transport system ATP-binding protein|nr:ATP-binding cassette domain-containing protein [Gaiella sp.]